MAIIFFINCYVYHQLLLFIITRDGIYSKNLTGNDHIPAVRGPVVDGGGIRLRVTLQRHVLSNVGPFQLIWYRQHWRNYEEKSEYYIHVCKKTPWS